MQSNKLFEKIGFQSKIKVLAKCENGEDCFLYLCSLTLTLNKYYVDEALPVGLDISWLIVLITLFLNPSFPRTVPPLVLILSLAGIHMSNYFWSP